MAHPFEQHKNDKVEKSRVSGMLKGYAGGGAVPRPDNLVNGRNKTALQGTKSTTPSAITGAMATSRLDKPKFAAGGRANGKTNVNVIVAPSHQPAPGGPPPMMGGAMPPGPIPHPAPPMPPPGGPPMGGGMPPAGMPVRKAGGRVNKAKGGGLGAAKMEGDKNGTQVQHLPGKNDLNKISTKPPMLTRKSGGRTYPIDDGAGGGAGRLEKIKAYG